MIKDDVREIHLPKFPEEIEIIKKIEADFDVTWAKRVTSFNTEISIYFLKPLAHISQAFGFEQEIVLVISNYASLEARMIQAIEQFFQQLPARGRVDQTVAVVVSSARNVQGWLSDYASRNPQTRAYVGLAKAELIEATEGWFFRNKLDEQLFLVISLTILYPWSTIFFSSADRQ